MRYRVPILIALLLTVLCVLSLAAPSEVSAQTNPCAAPLPGLQVNPSVTYATLIDHETLVVGSTTEKLVASYTARVFEQSKNPATDPPFTTISIPRTAWSLVSGTTDCYRSTHAYPVTPGIVFKADLVANANPLANVANSDPSAVTNPFGLQAQPRVGAVRVLPDQ